jgi:hypothetical protein
MTMRNLRLLIAAFLMMLVMGCTSQDIASDHPRHGEMKESDPILVWESSGQEWISPDAFWLIEAELRGGLTWRKNSVYPAYDDVKEFDTFLVEVPSGTCLMAFYHSRWRRANDVWRWDPGFNTYSGCSAVFD